jgi:hypothetical protein
VRCNPGSPHDHKQRNNEKYRAVRGDSVFYAFYAIAIIVLILHFNGWLKRHNMEWLVLLIAALMFPVILFLR